MKRKREARKVVAKKDITMKMKKVVSEIKFEQNKMLQNSIWGKNSHNILNL